MFGLALLDYLQCNLFPDSTDCVGHQEVVDAKIRAEQPGELIAHTWVETGTPVEVQ